MNDSEHGYFHGVMVSFIMYLINQDENTPTIVLTEKHYATTLLHDFLKPNGYPQEEHDVKLKEFFPLLLPEGIIFIIIYFLFIILIFYLSNTNLIYQSISPMSHLLDPSGPLRSPCYQ